MIKYILFWGFLFGSHAADDLLVQKFKKDVKKGYKKIKANKTYRSMAFNALINIAGDSRAAGGLRSFTSTPC